MLARFENGYYLEVLHDKKENEYNFTIYDKEFEIMHIGWTEYRSIEMYYPSNEIDYILQFCEPDRRRLKGKYELLPFETMYEYEEYFDEITKEDPNGEWILETQGTIFDDIRYFKTEEGARMTMLQEIAETDLEVIRRGGNFCESGCSETYQYWEVYRKEEFETEKEKVFDEIGKTIDRAYRGIDHYAWELQDSWAAYRYLDELTELIDKLKEMM